MRKELLHAWSNYERYAWGHDALKPLGKGAHDWYGQSLLMTSVDALDTVILMKLDAEADKARELIATELSFDRDISVKNFEITIRFARWITLELPTHGRQATAGAGGGADHSCLHARLAQG